jgi:hypothetical protein
MGVMLRASRDDFVTSVNALLGECRQAMRVAELARERSAITCSESVEGRLIRENQGALRRLAREERAAEEVGRRLRPPRSVEHDRRVPA